jgi:hypothetical protein
MDTASSVAVLSFPSCSIPFGKSSKEDQKESDEGVMNVSANFALQNRVLQKQFLRRC